ncbi:MAG: helicase [Methylocapsa sp.]|nr:helicase [Methylocapsa sp.]
MNISFPAARLFAKERGRSVTILLGPTNTGKTHYALERMLCYPAGMIGLPLRLLAREIYNRAVERAGADAVALITGEEKIKPRAPRYWVSTVEAMPRNLDLPFVAVDEIQLAADLDRGHIFTDRLLNWRGREETLLIGAATMTRLTSSLLPGARLRTRPRLSKLSYSGAKKMTRLRRRSAIVAFSVEDVYAIAEWIRRHNGGTAVVLGALSPRTRNRQVDMFQNGDVDYIVATDAIGMGLNLDVDHIAFAAGRKFDGWQHRALTPAEFGQIAGRAGRYHRDGTFGTTGRCPPFDAPLVEALEEHRFDEVTGLQWRNSELDFSSLAALAASLDALPKEPGLTRAPLAIDQMVLDVAARDANAARHLTSPAEIARLWECCQIPDYRKLSPAAHAELVLAVFGFVARGRHIPEDWFACHVAAQDRTDGGLDILSSRIAEVRTWTFIANRSGWLRDPGHWQTITRQVEDRLSDALHERLTQRFVDRRTSVLMRRLRENAMLEAVVTPSGDVLVEGQHIGKLIGLRFTADPEAAGEAAKTLNAAAQKALATEIERRAARLSEAVDDAFLLANDGVIRWLGEPAAKICPGEHVLRPRVSILADEQLTGESLAIVQRRLDLWLAQHVAKLLGPLFELEKGEGLEGIARGIAFHIAESLGILERARVSEDVKSLSQEGRASLRNLGVRFGAHHLYLPILMKPAPRALAAQLHALKHGGVHGLDDVLHLAASGRTSFAASKDIPKNLYRAAGFTVCETRAVRVDILERLADLIRPAVAYRPDVTPGDPPPGAADGNGFTVTVAMTSLAGCSGDSFAALLRSLGYSPERRKGKAVAPASAAAGFDLVSARAPAVVPGGATEIRPQKEASQGPPEPLTGVETACDGAAPVLPQPEDNQALAPPDQSASGDSSSPDGLGERVGPDPGDSQVPPRADGTATLPGAAEDSEPVIEIWRPHRHHHHPRKIKAQPFGAADAKETAGSGARQRERATSKAAWRGAIEKTPAAPAQAAPSQASVPGEDRHFPDRKREHKEGGREGHAATNVGAGGQRGRFRAKENKRPGERPPDPNSPFAKLLVLKAQLESKDSARSGPRKNQPEK